MHLFKTKVTLASVLCLFATAVIAQEVNEAELKPLPAVHSPIAKKAEVISAAWAGERVVSVGDHGIVLLSDDQGKTYRQAKSVPVSSQLTSVSFIDSKKGWAVGHWGAILVTEDAGETWKIQRLDTNVDRPLFAVNFSDALHGTAIGLWSLVLSTEDGGKTWIKRELEPPANRKKADLNLYSLFSSVSGTLYATAEKGQVLTSSNRGATWKYIDTGYKGSLWAGAVLPSGELLVAGQRGSLMKGSSDGSQWEKVTIDTTSSITSITVHEQNVLLTGLDGFLSMSNDAAKQFTALKKAGEYSYTWGLLSPKGLPVLFSRTGVVPNSK